MVVPQPTETPTLVPTQIPTPEEPTPTPLPTLVPISTYTSFSTATAKPTFTPFPTPLGIANIYALLDSDGVADVYAHSHWHSQTYFHTTANLYSVPHTHRESYGHSCSANNISHNNTDNPVHPNSDSHGHAGGLYSRELSWLYLLVRRLCLGYHVLRIALRIKT